MSAHAKRVLVNVTTKADRANIRHEVRNGRDVIIVPSATLPDNVVMNGILYPPEEIASAFKSLHRTPAPLGHPSINGKFVSALDPEGINLGWIGAWNENVRQEKGRVLLDKVIDVARAKESAGGRAVLAAVESGDPIHTSTGLLCNLEAANGNVEHKFIARNIEFDHDAILLDEEGAATPDQGVGMMVNSAGEEIEVINSMLEDADRDLDWAVESAVRALKKKQDLPLFDRVKKALSEAILGNGDHLSEQHNNEDTMDKAQFDALSGEMKTLSDAVTALPTSIATAIGESVTNALKPFTDAQTALANKAKEDEDAERASLIEKIVAANILDADTAAEMTLNAARKLAPSADKQQPKKAAALNAAGHTPSGAQSGFLAPKGDD